MPESGGHDLLKEWQEAMQSVVSSAASAAGRSALPRQLITPMQRQFDLVQELFERERKLQRDLLARTFAPFARRLRPARAERRSVASAGRGVERVRPGAEQAASMIEVQADLFQRTVKTLREPAEIAKAAAGLERRPRARRARKS